MKTSFRLRTFLVASLRHYWLTHLAIILGVMVGAAVIGGAFIVGDSMRASLRQMTLDRLGSIHTAVTGFRFFREDLASQFPTDNGQQAPTPALVLVGSVEKTLEGVTRRAAHVNVYGVDDRAWSLVAPPEIPAPRGNGVYLSPPLAAALQAQAGDQLTLWLELPSAVPRDTLLGKKDNDSSEVTVRVELLLPDGPGAARLGLLPTQSLPLNLFIPLSTLQSALDLEKVAPNRRDPEGQLARVNTLFLGDAKTASPASPTQLTASVRETETLKKHWSLADLNLRIVHDKALNVMSLESEQMLLEDRFSSAALVYAKQHQLAASPVMVYLANSLRNPRDPKAYSMYSTVVGLDVLDLPEEFGPFPFEGAQPDSLAEDDVIINRFLADDLKVSVGDTINYAYHVVGSQGELPEIQRTATVRGIVKMEGAAIDRQLTPTVKGITDADSLDDWDQPFEMDLDAVTPRDDEYWNDYRATPKVFFRLDTAQKLWPNRYGSLTSVRIALPEGKTFEAARADLEQALLSTLDPADLGLAFQPLREEGLKAASGANNFTGLFVGFSMFLIFAAMILVGLLFRLAVEQRASQWGLLSALGYSPSQVRRLILAEGAGLVVIGGVLGAFAAVLYAKLMIFGLNTWWNGAIGTQLSTVSIQPVSVLSGVVAAVLTSFLAVWWGLRQLQRVAVRQQLAGVAEVEPPVSSHASRGPFWRAAISAATAILLVAGVIVGVIPETEAFSGFAWPVIVFFVAGMLTLMAGLWGLSAWLQTDTSLPIRGRGLEAVIKLGLRNAARRRQRSVLTTGLIASATFVVVAVAAAQKNPAVDKPDLNSGNGGFTLVAESTTPLLYDLNTADGRKKLNLQGKTPEQIAALAATTVIPFRVQPGEDASCLNLFQTRLPTILGAPEAMLQRGGFEFIGGGPRPWDKLRERNADGSIPVYGDMNTLMYSLKKTPGQTIAIPSEDHPEHQLKIAGMFDGAVFQGVLVMSETEFLKLYPDRKGFQYFLIDVPQEHATAAAELLETDLAEYGLDTEPVAERLARFLAVQNTYLATFQSLGGLGLILGTFGLATVMLRNVLERQAELALFRAVGFRPAQVASLVFAEAALLLGWGLTTGACAAGLSMLPHLLSAGADASIAGLLGLLLTVGGVGLAATGGAIRAALNVPIVSTLRGE